MTVSKYFNDKDKSNLLTVGYVQDSETWIAINIYRGGFDHDELDITKEEALLLRDALTELLNE